MIVLLNYHKPFLVMATQNPVEQEGTYPLPEAQVDRFMLKVKIGYPTKDEEIRIMKRVSIPSEINISKIMTTQKLWN
ncbi:MAG: AAA family ATPase [Bacteriovoracaceae bacterium]